MYSKFIAIHLVDTLGRASTDGIFKFYLQLLSFWSIYFFIFKGESSMNLL